LQEVFLCVEDDTNQEGDGKASAQDEGKHFDDGCEFFHAFNLSEVE
jgi:hypothetical protein